MNRLDRYASTVALVLVLGGLMALGAFAGVRVAFGLVTHTLECGTLTGVDCVPLLRRLNDVGQTFAVGGGVAMVCGGIGLWILRREETVETESNHA